MLIWRLQSKIQINWVTRQTVVGFSEYLNFIKIHIRLHNRFDPHCVSKLAALGLVLLNVPIESFLTLMDDLPLMTTTLESRPANEGDFLLVN